MKEWIEVVAAATKAEADMKFREWKEAHPELVRELGNGDVRVDIVRTIEKKTLFRYMIRTCGPAALH